MHLAIDLYVKHSSHCSFLFIEMSVISSTIKTTQTSKVVTLSAGCFWGVEAVFVKYFKDKGLIDTKVGYANGLKDIGAVNYKQVCSGKTNFVESVQITYEPSQVSLKEIFDIFFRIHDPTTLNLQGPDVGTQYRSAILAHSDEDLQIAKDSKDYFQKEWYPNDKISTITENINIWYDAEDYHQHYLAKNPEGYECPTHFLRTKPKV